jgi:hypothetical protein
LTAAVRRPFHLLIDPHVRVNAVFQENADRVGGGLADCLVEKDGLNLTPVFRASVEVEEKALFEKEGIKLIPVSGASGAEEEKATFERVGPVILRCPEEELVPAGLELSIRASNGPRLIWACPGS